MKGSSCLSDWQLLLRYKCSWFTSRCSRCCQIPFVSCPVRFGCSYMWSLVKQLKALMSTKQSNDRDPSSGEGTVFYPIRSRRCWCWLWSGVTKGKPSSKAEKYWETSWCFTSFTPWPQFKMNHFILHVTLCGTVWCGGDCIYFPNPWIHWEPPDDSCSPHVASQCFPLLAFGGASFSGLCLILVEGNDSHMPSCVLLLWFPPVVRFWSISPLGGEQQLTLGLLSPPNLW